MKKDKTLIDSFLESRSKILFPILILCGIFIFRNAAFSEVVPPETNESAYKIEALPLPDQIFFAGEEVVLDDPDIKERLDRETTCKIPIGNQNALLLLKRANKYFPLIETILAEYQIPDDFKYLALIEKWSSKRYLTSRSQRILANYASNWKGIWIRD